MINRRKFLQTAALSATGALISNQLFAQTKWIPKVGIQFFSVPKALDTDFAGTVKMLAGIGYKEAELYGPYSFSTQAAKDEYGMRLHRGLGLREVKLQTVAPANEIKASP